VGLIENRLLRKVQGIRKDKFSKIGDCGKEAFSNV